MTASPLIIISKILYDGAHSDPPLRPMSDFNAAAYFLRTDLDFTTNETFWAAFFATFPNHMMRLGLDQMTTQRFLAARSLRDARIVAFVGASLMSISYAFHGLTALAMVYWFRDCDPVLSGFIAHHDQMVPYYVQESAGAVDGLRGLYLAGIASASISTASSIVNAHAAVLFIDIVSPNFHVPVNRSPLVMAGLAVASGTVMTLFALLVPYISSTARFFLAFYNGTAGPFAGIMILAFLFPWANARGTTMAALAVFAVQIWLTTGRFFSRFEPSQMQIGVDRCPSNSTSFNHALLHRQRDKSEVFPLYRISSYWCGALSTFSTVLIGLALSIVSGRSSDFDSAIRLSSPLMLNFWRRIGLLSPLTKGSEPVATQSRSQTASTVELQPLQVQGT